MLSLLLVGIVSGTVIRHVVQVVPAVMAGIAVLQRRSWQSMAALPILAFWLAIMILIWLYLLGVVRFFSGHFTTAEIGLTVVMGIACVAGLVSCVRKPRSLNWAAGLVALLIFGALQIGAMWVSFRPAIANR